MSDYKTAILMDSGGDLPLELCEREGIEFLPLHVIYPEGDYLDGVNIDPEMIYRRFPDEIPTTSMPSLQEIADKFRDLVSRGYENCIAVTISGGLSGTGNSIAIAAEQVPELNVTVFDTKNISIGSGVFALWAARKRAEGMGYRELVERLREKVSDSHLFFYMDTLKYLRHGGRIGRVASFIGEALHMKPIISCDENGIYYTVAKIRGAEMGKRRTLEEVIRAVGDKHCWVMVGHGAAPDEAERMEGILKKELKNMEFLFTKQINATLANNTGPGLLGVLAFVDP